MISETKLDKIKYIACEWLMYPLVETDKSPTVVNHPFFRSAVVCFKENEKLIRTNLFEDEVALAHLQIQFEKTIMKAENISQIRDIITYPYRLAFLQRCAKFMSNKDYSEFLANSFILCEHPETALNMNQKVLLEMFKKANKRDLMRPDEYKTFENLPDFIEIYRGVTPKNAGHISSMSWTKNFDVANWFACRYGERGNIYRAFIDKKYVFAYFNLREEEEVVVNPSKLYNIRKIYTSKEKRGFDEMSK